MKILEGWPQQADFTWHLHVLVEWITIWKTKMMDKSQPENPCRILYKTSKMYMTTNTDMTKVKSISRREQRLQLIRYKKKTHCYFRYKGFNIFLSWITLWIRTLFNSGGFVFKGTRLQPLQKPHYLGPQQGVDSMWPYHNKSETDTRLSAVDLRSGWLSRPGSVLAEDHPDFFSHTPREPGDFKSVKNGKSRLPGDYRLNRDWH